MAATRRRTASPEFDGTFEIGISSSVVMPPAEAARVPEASAFVRRLARRRS